MACRRDEAIRIYLFKSVNPALSDSIDTNDEQGWKPLLDVDLSQSDLVIQENDLISYDWPSQTFTLTADFRKRYENEKDSFWFHYFVFTLGETPIVGGLILPPISAMGSRIPVLQESLAMLNSENHDLEMVLQPNNLSGATSLFPGDDAALIEKVRQRLQTIGKLVERVEPQAESTASAELVVVGRLVHIDVTPGCGTEHVGAMAEYTDLTIVSGVYPHETIFVMHGCPELKRSEYAQGSGDLESFRAGDYHELHLTRQDVYGLLTSRNDTVFSDERFYFCREVNLHH